MQGKALALNLPKPGSGARKVEPSKEHAPTLQGFENDLLAGFEDQDEDVENLEVENILSKIIMKRKEGSKQKEAQLVADTASKVKTSADTLQAAINKEARDIVTAANAKISKVESSLNGTLKSMEALTDKYQQDMHQLWKTYSEQYDQLTRDKANVKANIEKRRTGLKRKVDELKDVSGKAVADVEGRLHKLRANSSKLPGVLQALQSLMEGNA